MGDEELGRSAELQGEVFQGEFVRNNYSKGVGMNQKGYGHDEMGIDNGTEKSRELRKHDSKERKKERREEKDYGSKEKDRSKQRRREDISGRDAEKHGSKENIGSSREKKKEFLGDYVKDIEALEFDREKIRDKTRAKDCAQSKLRDDRKHEHAKDKGRKHDKGKDIGRNRGRNIDREHEECRDHGKDRGREGKYKVKEREKEKDIDHSRDRIIDKDYDQSRDQVKGKTRRDEEEKVVERNRVLHREHGYGKELEKACDHHRDRDEYSEGDKDKLYDKSKARDKDHYQEIDKELERDKIRDKNNERGKDKEKEKGQDYYWPKEMEREKLKYQEKKMISDKVGEWDKFENDKSKKRHREKEMDVGSDRDRYSGRDIERDINRKVAKVEDNLFAKHLVDGQGIVDAPNKISSDSHSVKAMGSQTISELAERLKRIREERVNGNSEDVSEVLSWVNKSRKLEEKRNSENEMAIALARKLDEQDKILDESEDEEPVEDNKKYLAGVKVLHGLDKVMEGATVVLTLKDQNILADGDVNEEADMLESVEIGEQKRRNEAYSAAKKTGIYDDKFNDDLISRKTALSQYDDPVDNEGIMLDESGRFTGEAEKKLAELRKRIEGKGLEKDYVDLSSPGKIQSDYFTTDEMLQFKRPKKKKSLRKKERLDLDALEVEARASGLGHEDLGSRGDTNRRSAREEEEKNMAETRSNAYQAALNKAEEASKVLRQGLSLTSKPTDDDNLFFGEDYEDLQKSLEQARKLTLKNLDEAPLFGPQAVALLATALREQDNSHISTVGETQENKVVITEMEEFVFGLQTNEDFKNPESDDVFKDDEDDSVSNNKETKKEYDYWNEAKETEMSDLSISEKNDDITPDEIIHETAVGKGLSGALKLLKDRGTLKESIDWGGRNMDKKKSKLVGIYANDGSKEVRIERTDEFGRILTPKEAFRILSHKFHGKGPGKMKIEKRMKQYYEDLKTKHMKASDTPLLAMEKMREAQARLQSPYLVLSGNVKPGQTSDPRSGFATVEKDNPGSLTPMLGDKKVEHFLGIRSKPESGSMGPPPAKKPKL